MPLRALCFASLHLLIQQILLARVREMAMVAILAAAIQVVMAAALLIRLIRGRGAAETVTI